MASMTATAQPLLDEIVANDLESRTLAEARDALLPKLLSGEVHIYYDSVPAVSGG
jgi:type I restriction enzyme S subunit